MLAWMACPGRVEHYPFVNVTANHTHHGDVCSGCQYVVNVTPGPAALANALTLVCAGGTINVAAGTYTEHDLMVSKNVTITGASAADTIVDAAQLGRGFTINAGVTATIRNITIRNGKAD